MQETLDQPLVTGALAPAVALKYAADIAAAVRAMHRQWGAHGAIGLEYICLETSDAILLPPLANASDARVIDDVTAFGAVLFEMLTGAKPAEIGNWQAAFGTIGLRAAGLALAERCMAATVEAGPDMQKASIELRLLVLLARRQESLASTIKVKDVWAEPPPTGAACPKCERYQVHPSKARTTTEMILKSQNCRIYRCHFCYYRFVDIYGMRADMNH